MYQRGESEDPPIQPRNGDGDDEIAKGFHIAGVGPVD